MSYGYIQNLISNIMNLYRQWVNRKIHLYFFWLNKLKALVCLILRIWYFCSQLILTSHFHVNWSYNASTRVNMYIVHLKIFFGLTSSKGLTRLLKKVFDLIHVMSSHLKNHERFFDARIFSKSKEHFKLPLSDNIIKRLKHQKPAWDQLIIAHLQNFGK